MIVSYRLRAAEGVVDGSLSAGDAAVFPIWPHRELVSEHEVAVRDVSDGRGRSVSSREEVLNIAVDMLLLPVELPVEPALSVREWGHVIDHRLPRHRLSPQPKLYTGFQVRTRRDE